MKNNKSNLLGIYIHIPFCVRKCNYCDFLSFTASEKIKKKYVEALIGEIKYMSHTGRDRLVTSIFFGGGTPSVLDADYIKMIMKAINDNFNVAHNCETTIEANPGTITEEKAEAYRECGFNRISFGLQTTDNDVLKTIGRIHTYEDFLESYEIARKAGFTNINIDMMQALPGQSLEEYVKGLKKVIELKPEHISAYSLIVEEGTHLYEHLSEYPQLPDEDEERQIYYATGEMLENAGYSRYEISNYAKEGYCCNHNMIYWQRGNYLGMGLGASSLLDEVRYKNTSDMEEYLTNAGVRSVVEVTEELGEKDAMSEFMFLGLRLTAGVSDGEFQRDFGKHIADVYGKAIEKNITLGLLEEYADGRGMCYRLTEKGVDVSNIVMSDFLL